MDWFIVFDVLGGFKLKFYEFFSVFMVAFRSFEEIRFWNWF